MKKQQKTKLSATNAQSVHSRGTDEETRHPRTDSRYWLDRVEKVRSKKGTESPNYSIQIAQGGTRHRFKLETAERKAAAKKAQRIFMSILTNGWDKALADHNPKAASRSRCATVGEFLAELYATVSFRKSTRRVYEQSLHTIAAGIAGIEDQPAMDGEGNVIKEKGKVTYLSRYGRHTGGNAAWVEKIHELPLSILTAEKVTKWKLAYVEEAGDSPLAAQRARHTVNSMIRSSRSLFSNRKGRLRHVMNTLQLPAPLPFAGVLLEKEGTMRYQSKVDVKQLIQDAKKELATSATKQEQFKIFCLGLLAGLRKMEIDTLLWEQVEFDSPEPGKGRIALRRTDYFEPKSRESEAKVDCDPELVALLRGWKARTKGAFVVQSDNPPLYAKKGAAYYRCQDHFKALYTWLRGKGAATEQKPLHMLRKELGSVLANEQGIFAAQQVLRHAQIQTTARHYADRRRFMTAGLGAMLGDVESAGGVIAFPKPEGATATNKTKPRRRAGR